MSFNDLSKPQLIKVADFFGAGVDIDEEGKTKDTKAEIIAKLEQDGVTEEQYESQYLVALKAAEEQKESEQEDRAQRVGTETPSKVSKDDTLLVKMKRRNPTFSVMGYNFTQRHPFVPVPTADAEYIINHFHGFSIALPSEVEAYYN